MTMAFGRIASALGGRMPTGQMPMNTGIVPPQQTPSVMPQMPQMDSGMWERRTPNPMGQFVGRMGHVHAPDRMMGGGGFGQFIQRMRGMTPNG